MVRMEILILLSLMIYTVIQGKSTLLFKFVNKINPIFVRLVLELKFYENYVFINSSFVYIVRITKFCVGVK